MAKETIGFKPTNVDLTGQVALVTGASRGIGRALLHHLERHAKDMECDVLALDSGTQRTDAHRFYFREGMVIPSFCFRKNLK